MLMDLEMHTCTSHMITTRELIYHGLTGRNTSGWRLKNLANDGGLANKLTSNMKGCSGENLPLHLIHIGSAVHTTQIHTRRNLFFCVVQKYVKK